MVFVGFLLVGGKGRDTGGVGGLDDAIEVETDGFVGKRLGFAATELLAETCIVNTVTDGACLLNKGWVDLCHSIGIGI